MKDNNNIVKLPTGFLPPPPMVEPDVREHLIIQSQMIATLSDEVTELSKLVGKLVRVLKERA